MSFIRPAVLAWFGRWAETMIAASCVAVLIWFGAQWLWAGVVWGVFLLLGGILAAGWVWAAMLRARAAGFARRPGIVVIEEQRIGYLGPQLGGFITFDQMCEVAVLSERGKDAGLIWQLSGRDGECLFIPAGADGAAMLVETLSALKGFDIATMARVLYRHGHGGPVEERAVLWRRPPRSLIG